MNDDPRWLDWLEWTERMLDAPPQERIEELACLQRKREALQQALEREAPGKAPLPSRGLQAKLREAETRLGQLCDALGQEIRDQLAAVRYLRDATRGYKPTEENIPAFLSRSI